MLSILNHTFRPDFVYSLAFGYVVCSKICSGSLTCRCPCGSPLDFELQLWAGKAYPADAGPVWGHWWVCVEAQCWCDQQQRSALSKSGTAVGNAGMGSGSGLRTYLRPAKMTSGWWMCWRQASPGGGHRPEPRSSSAWCTSGPYLCYCRENNRKTFNTARKF